MHLLLPLSFSLVLGVATAAIHQVTVGAGGKLAFEPNNIIAAVGDSVEFTFFPKNHSITQSTFAQPCQPLLQAQKQIYSGFVPTAAPGPNPSKFRISIDDAKKPIWLYCSQTVGAHCQNGMVMAVNAAGSGNATFAAYLELAKAAKSPSLQPADVGVQGGSFVTDTATTAQGSATTGGVMSTYTSSGRVFTTFFPTVTVTQTVDASSTSVASASASASASVTGGAGRLSMGMGHGGGLLALLFGVGIGFGVWGWFLI